MKKNISPGKVRSRKAHLFRHVFTVAGTGNSLHSLNKKGEIDMFVWYCRDDDGTPVLFEDGADPCKEGGVWNRHSEVIAEGVKDIAKFLGNKNGFYGVGKGREKRIPIQEELLAKKKKDEERFWLIDWEDKEVIQTGLTWDETVKEATSYLGDTGHLSEFVDDSKCLRVIPESCFKMFDIEVKASVSLKEAEE